MRKKINLGLNDEMSSTERKSRVEKILGFLEKNNPSISDDQLDYEESKSRLLLSSSTILILSIVGTLLITGSSLYYLSIPSPSANVTTQDGRLIEIKPIRVIR